MSKSLLLILFPNRFREFDWSRFELSLIAQEYNADIKVHDMTSVLYSDTRKVFPGILKDNSISNRNKIIATGQKVKDELEKSEDMISRKHILFRDIQQIKSGFEKPNQILIDNRNGRTEVYAKKTIANIVYKK